MIKIREANSSDVVQLQRLVAEWIGTRTLPPAEETINAIDLTGCFNGSNYFWAVAEDEDTKALIGYALSTYNYAVWLGKSLMLENIFVREEYRLKGIGKRLISSVLKHALEKGCQNVNFYTEDNDESAGFFVKMGGIDKTATEGWLVYTVPLEKIQSNCC